MNVLTILKIIAGAVFLLKQLGVDPNKAFKTVMQAHDEGREITDSELDELEAEARRKQSEAESRP